MNILAGENKIRLIVLMIGFIISQSLMAADFSAFEELRKNINKQVSAALELSETLTGNNVKDCEVLYRKLTKGMPFETVMDILKKAQNKNNCMFKISLRKSGAIYFTTRMDNPKYSIEHLISVNFYDEKLKSINISVSFVEL